MVLYCRCFDAFGGLSYLKICPPVNFVSGFQPMANLEQLIIDQGSGMQKQAYMLKMPKYKLRVDLCLSSRPNNAESSLSFMTHLNLRPSLMRPVESDG